MPRKKIINRHDVHTELDAETGEFKRIITDQHIGLVDQEPDYIKIYIGTQLSLNNLDPSRAPYIIAFGPYMTYANDAQYQHMVQTSDLVREGVASTLGVSPKRVEQIIKKLIDSGIFIPIYRQTEKDGVITRQKKRGIYFVNPWVVGKGSWKDIKALQQTIDFVRGESSYFISDESGTRKITCSLPAAKYHQLEFDSNGEIK